VALIEKRSRDCPPIVYMYMYMLGFIAGRALVPVPAGVNFT